jgi:oligoendopeptidase F
MATSHFSLNWNLDSLFPGGSQSPALHSAIDHLKHQLQRFKRKFKQISDLKKGILYFQELEGQCQDLEYFIGCLLAQNVNDQEAIQFHSQITTLKANCDSIGEELNALLAELDKGTFTKLISDPDIESIAFHLKERRQQAKEKLPVEQEKLVHQLGINGYQGWNEIYEAFIGQLRIPSPFPPEGSLSVGQADNRLSHPDRNIRQAWFQRFRQTWMDHENLAAQMLNHMAGFRLNLYAARGWSSILKEPLFYNRMQEKTLKTMWSTIEKHKEILQKYLSCKAQLLGMKKLAWYDVDAPLPMASKANIPFHEAAHFIIQHFTDFSPAMGEFAKLAFKERWIEAEDRSGKRQGGFCAPLMHAKQSRIFMTYSGTMNNVFTLAHELGHAYHSYEMRDLPLFAQQYRMNVAETASTLAEMVIIDSMIKQSTDTKTQLALLDNKLQRAVVFLMNIHARYLFELDFYEERRKGFVLAKQLNVLMEKAQKQAYCDSLSEWHPYFWISKQHFYFTGVPFYNFPYTFGYLFSQGMYAHLKQKKGAAEAYASLLRDSGSLPTEELAERHLHVKLEEADFWEEGLRLIGEDVKTYLKLAAMV